jgi:hypothetical protein
MPSVLNTIYDRYAGVWPGLPALNGLTKSAMMPMPGGALPPDPAMMGGGGGMPPPGMDPSMMGAPPPGMDPAMMGMPPPGMDPAMMGGGGGMPPPDPAAAMGGLAGAGPLDPASLGAMPGATPPPPGEGADSFSDSQKQFLEQLIMKVTQAVISGGGAGGAAGGKKNVEAKIDELTGMIKSLMAYNAGKEGKPPDAVPGLQGIGAQDTGDDGMGMPPSTKIAGDFGVPGVRRVKDYEIGLTGGAAELAQAMNRVCEQYHLDRVGHSAK